MTNRPSNGSRYVERGGDGTSFTGPEKIMEKLNEQLKEQGKASVEISENEAAKTKTVWVNPRQYKSVGYNQRAEGTRIYWLQLLRVEQQSYGRRVFGHAGVGDNDATEWVHVPVHGEEVTGASARGREKEGRQGVD